MRCSRAEWLYTVSSSSPLYDVAEAAAEPGADEPAAERDRTFVEPRLLDLRNLAHGLEELEAAEAANAEALGIVQDEFGRSLRHTTERAAEPARAARAGAAAAGSD